MVRTPLALDNSRKFLPCLCWRSCMCHWKRMVRKPSVGIKVMCCCGKLRNNPEMENQIFWVFFLSFPPTNVIMTSVPIKTETMRSGDKKYICYISLSDGPLTLFQLKQYSNTPNFEGIHQIIKGSTMRTRMLLLYLNHHLRTRSTIVVYKLISSKYFYFKISSLNWLVRLL